MSKKKTKRTSKEIREHVDEVIRAKCINWDSEVPVHVARSNKEHATIARKVICKGIRQIAIPKWIYDTVMANARAGWETRFTCSGIERGRAFPCLTKDLRRVKIVLQALNQGKELEGLKFKFFTNGEEITRAECEAMAEEMKTRHEQVMKNRTEVTPDMVVTCPNCGTEIRVGRAFVK